MENIEGGRSLQKENIASNDIVDVLYPYPYEKLPRVKELERLNKTVFQRYTYFHGLNFEEILKDYAGKIIKYFPKADFQENNDFLKRASRSWIEVFNSPHGHLKNFDENEVKGLYIWDEHNLNRSFTILVSQRAILEATMRIEGSSDIPLSGKALRRTNQAILRHIIMHEALHAFIGSRFVDDGRYIMTSLHKLYEEGINFYAAEIFKKENLHVEGLRVRPFFENWQVFFKVMGEKAGREFIFQEEGSMNITSVLKNRWGIFFPKMKSLVADALITGKWKKTEKFINKIPCQVPLSN